MVDCSFDATILEFANDLDATYFLLNSSYLKSYNSSFVH